MVCWSAYTVYGKRVLATYSSALATTAAYVLGTLVLIPLAVISLRVSRGTRGQALPSVLRLGELWQRRPEGKLLALGGP